MKIHPAIAAAKVTFTPAPAGTGPADIEVAARKTYSNRSNAMAGARLHFGAKARCGVDYTVVPVGDGSRFAFEPATTYRPPAEAATTTERGAQEKAGLTPAERLAAAKAGAASALPAVAAVLATDAALEKASKSAADERAAFGLCGLLPEQIAAERKAEALPGEDEGVPLALRRSETDDERAEREKRLQASMAGEIRMPKERKIANPPSETNGGTAAAAASATQEADMAKAKKKATSKARSSVKGKTTKAAGATGDKTAAMLKLLGRKNGATVDELTEALGWLPHTLRARISTLQRDDKKIKIERTRVDGVTSYKLAA